MISLDETVSVSRLNELGVIVKIFFSCRLHLSMSAAPIRAMEVREILKRKKKTKMRLREAQGMERYLTLSLVVQSDGVWRQLMLMQTLSLSVLKINSAVSQTIVRGKGSPGVHHRGTMLPILTAVAACV